MGLLDGLLSAALPTDNPLVSMVLEHAQNYPGGISGLLEAWQNGDVAEIVQGLLNGEQSEVDASHVTSLFGEDTVQQFASQLGIEPEQVTSQLAEYLPQVLGQVQGGEMNVGSLLSQGISKLFG